MTKLCIFDLDGTLINSLPTIAYYANLALSESGLEPIDEEKYRYFIGDGKKNLIHRALAYYDRDTKEDFEKVIKSYDAHYEADTMYLTKAYDGVEELISFLKKRDTKIAICSNKPHNVVCDIAKLLFGDSIDFVQGQKETVPIKPAPDSVFAIMQKLEVEKEDCIFIGDTNVDMQTAKNAGIKSIGVLWGFRDEAELKDAKADIIVSHPLEILKFI